jgi:hypothetical protein
MKTILAESFILFGILLLFVAAGKTIIYVLLRIGRSLYHTGLGMLRPKISNPLFSPIKIPYEI